MRYARGERIVEQKNVNLKLDKITASPIPLIIATQSDAGYDDGRQVGMQAGYADHALPSRSAARGSRSSQFIGPDGKEIQATINGSGSNGYVHQTYYQLADEGRDLYHPGHRARGHRDGDRGLSRSARASASPPASGADCRSRGREPATSGGGPGAAVRSRVEPG